MNHRALLVRIALGAAFVAAPTLAVPETASFCGPSSGMGCENSSDLMVFLNHQMDVMSGTGNIGTPSGLPLMSIVSDGGALNMFIDLSNGFATITPAHPAVTFNGLDITVPGYTFTQLVFDEQLTPTNPTMSSYNFTVSGYEGAHVLVGTGNESDAADTDKEFSITAVNGVFDEVNILSLTGFDEMKHFEIEGLEPVVTVASPEPRGIMLVGLGLVGLAYGFGRRRA